MSVLAPVGTAGFRWNVSNQTVPALNWGTNVVPGASNAEGLWTQIFSALANDVYGILFTATLGATSTVSKMHLMDVGYDPAGGTSYTEAVPNLGCGSSGNALSGGISFFVPIFIPAGSTVAVRCQGNASTVGNFRVRAIGYGLPVRPEFAQKLTFAETLGTITNSCGPVVVPGLTAAEGAWTSIGTTTQAWRYVLPLLQFNDTSTASQVFFLDVAHGDGSNKVIVGEHITYVLPGTAEAVIGGPGINAPDLWCNIPAGATIYVRLSTDLGTAETCNVLVTGLG